MKEPDTEPKKERRGQKKEHASQVERAKGGREPLSGFYTPACVHTIMARREWGGGGGDDAFPLYYYNSIPRQ